MNSSWMLSSVLVSMLIGAAALCVERVLMLRRGTPVRWVWMTAIVVSIAWSARWLLPAPPVVETALAVSSLPSEPADVVIVPSAASKVAPSVPESAPSIDLTPGWTTALTNLSVAPLSEKAESRLLMLWLVASVTLLTALVWSHLQLTRDRGRWRATTLLGSDVLVSDGFGPAIVGMRRPSIVVPPWVLDVDVSAQRTILLHEDEHRRARDQWLLVASFGALALAPWNVALWVMRRRLARAIELDCDQRVLSHGVADVDYANLLLNAWQLARGVMPWVPTPALAEHGSRLGRRVEHLMRPAPRGILMKTVGGTFMAFIVFGAAVLVPAPQQAQSRPTMPPPPPPAAPIPSLPAPTSEQVPPVPSTHRESGPPVPVSARVPSVPAPVRGQVPPVPAPSQSQSVPIPQREVPPVPAPALSKRPPVPPPASSVTVPPPASSGVQYPAIPLPAAAPSVPQKRGRLLVVLPWDVSSAQLVSAVHERLAADTRGQLLDVIPHAEFMRYVQAAGFESSRALKPADVKAISQLARADLVVALEIAPCNLAAGRCEVHPEENRLHVQASTIDPGEGVLVRIMDGNGSVASIADVLVRALHNVPAYKRLLSQSDATSAAPARYVVDSTGRLLGVFFRSTTTSAWKWRFNIDTAFRVYRSQSFAINWKTRFIIDTANSKFSFRFMQSVNPFFTRFGFDSTGRVTRLRPPPIG